MRSLVGAGIALTIVACSGVTDEGAVGDGVVEGENVEKQGVTEVADKKFPGEVAYINGVKYELIGKAVMETTTAEEIAERMAARGSSIQEFEDGRRVETFPAPEAEVDLRSMSVEQLAEKLRARALHASGYEYIEAVPPMDMARRMKAQLDRAETAPATAPAPGVQEAQDAARFGVESVQQDTRDGRYIIGSDDRVYTPSGNSWQVALLNGTSVQCSSTMISSKVAATAAHCVWNGSAWTIPGSFVPAANTSAPTQPYGTLTWSWIRIPNTGSTGSGWDYAYLEFSNSAAKGLSWLGTIDSSSGSMRMVGYPGDKPNPQMWQKDGSVSETTSNRRKHNLDVIPGDSGAGMYRIASSQVVGMQSTQNRSRTCFFWICGSWSYWNEVERWRLDTYNFFDAGNWPD